MSYTEADLPLTLKEAELLTLPDGTTVRFETSGEAKDIMVGDAWSPTETLFPGNDYTLESGGGQYKITALMEPAVSVEKL
jgi:hypothetical protein